MASASEALEDAEIALRDFVADILEEKFGDKWIENYGVTPERIEKWKERKEEEGKRRTSSYIDERLLYYSDISDMADSGDTVLILLRYPFSPWLLPLKNAT